MASAIQCDVPDGIRIVNSNNFVGQSAHEAARTLLVHIKLSKEDGAVYMWRSGAHSTVGWHNMGAGKQWKTTGTKWAPENNRNNMAPDINLPLSLELLHSVSYRSQGCWPIPCTWPLPGRAGGIKL